METTRHFTATTYIVHQGKVLLHWHKSLNCWLPPGGHIDRDELPEEAAVREVKEETGLNVALHAASSILDFGEDSTRELHPPIHILLEEINPFHQHIDFIYYASVDTSLLNPRAGETRHLRWFTAKEIGETNMPANVKVCAREALDILTGG